MTKCIFHDDKTPSMKVDERYYCFGCHETGDVIDFAAKLFELRPMDAAKRLADDFGIPVDEITLKYRADDPPKPKKPPFDPHQATVYFGILTDYLAMLDEWLIRYAPASPEEITHPRFRMALRDLNQLRHYQEGLLTGSKEEQIEITDKLRELIPEFEERLYEFGIDKLKEENNYYGNYYHE